MIDFFSQNIVTVFFFYGLAFFSMGFAILLELRHSSELDYARALRPLAGFGLIHGSHEWFEMFLMIQGQSEASWIIWLRLGLLSSSFLLLVAFGARLVASTQKHRDYWWIVGGITSLWLTSMCVLIIIIPAGADRVMAIDVLTRYTLAIPGAILTAIGLRKQQRIFNRSNMRPCGRDVTLAAVAFGLYGVVGQLFTPRSEFFPSPYINADVFLHWFGFPIQVFRSALAGIIAFFIVRSLRSIRVETSRKLDALRKAQEHEQKRLEELRAELLHRTVQAQESERHRIARELHDETGQTLTALGMGLRGLKTTIAGNPQQALEQASQLENLASAGLGELQRLVMGLHPPHLDDLGLLAAIRWYAGEVSQRYHLPVQINALGEEPQLTSEMRVTIFRITQEAITNAIRHANASQITISLVYRPDEIYLQIKDDGRGFDVDDVLAQTMDAKPAWGLLGIFERAALINGTCKITSPSGAGTSIELNVPIQREAIHA